MTSRQARDGELEELRAAARHAGAATEHDAGWFGRLLRERLERKSNQVDWSAVYPGLSADHRAERHIARACRKAALCGILSVGAANAIAATAAFTEGLTAVVGVPAALAALAVEPFASAVVQVDLTCDLSSIYGVPFELGDAGELAAVFDVAIRGPQHQKPVRAYGKRLLAPNDTEILAQVGSQLAMGGLFGLVPVAGIPLVSAKAYQKTRRLGYSAREYVRDRLAVREVLGERLRNPNVEATLLLQGAWLLVTSDDLLTHDEAVLLSTLARAIPPGRRPRLERFDLIGEAAWVMQMALLDDARCDATFRALEGLAMPYAKWNTQERSFLRRVAEGLGRELELA
jgi:hypothetical protein